MLDHVVQVYRDLDAELARADSVWRGFNVIPGGVHADGVTHNALVVGSNGTYIELVGFRDPERGRDHRWWKLATAQGEPADFALLSDDLDADVAALGDLVTRGAQVGGRIRPDGVRIEWRTALLAAPLPFLIQDITPRELRVPAGDAAQHPSGFVGVMGVLVTTPDVATAHARFARLRERGTVPVEVRGGPQPRLSWRLASRDLSRGVDRPAEG